MKQKLKELMNGLLPIRCNIKIIPDLWVLRPYKEKIFYTIDKENYTPMSYRILCFSIVYVTYNDIAANDKTNNIRRQ
jgi:hypothetical protein